MLKRIILSFITCGSLIACGGSSNSDSTTETMQLQSSKATCMSLHQQLCLKTGENLNFYDVIEGFDYEWGHSYEVSVKTSKIENPPADSSSVKYELAKVISVSEDDMGTQYPFKLVELMENTFTKESNVYYFLGQPFECQENVDCDSLVSMNNSGGLVNVTFEYKGNGKISLVEWN